MARNRENEQEASPDGASNDEAPFYLETVFRSPADLFSSYRTTPTKSDALVVLDANALLLPYNVGKEDLQAIADVYQKLADQKRLFVPARAAREFAKHRERKLAEMLHGLNERKAKLQLPSKQLAPLLRNVGGYDQAMDSYKALEEARKSYIASLDPLIAEIKSWRGDDPVSSMYQRLFDTGAIIGTTLSDQDSLLDEWKKRLEAQIPPGNKDAPKADTGIGDFLIWKSILRLGEDQKKDCVFITGEKKADWFVWSAS